MARSIEGLELIKLRRFCLAVYSLHALSGFVRRETDTAKQFGDHLEHVFGGVEDSDKNENTGADSNEVSYDEKIQHCKRKRTPSPDAIINEVLVLFQKDSWR